MNKEDLIKSFGNPGIWGYCKESECEGFLKQLNERGYFNDLERSGGVLHKEPFKDFRYKDSITHSDFSAELFSENDVVVGMWCVSKQYLKKEEQCQTK